MSIYMLTEQKTRVAREVRRCVWCGESIWIGEQYSHQVMTVDSEPSANDMHRECAQAVDEAVAAEGGPIIYMRFENERPAA